MTDEKKKDPWDALRADLPTQRRLLDAVNDAFRAEDLPDLFHEDAKVANKLVKWKHEFGPYGVRRIDELLTPARINPAIIEKIIRCFGPLRYGRWKLLPYPTQGPDGSTLSTAHAALLRTGEVMFLPSWDPTDRVETMLWDPTDETTPQFSFPNNQPTDYLFCAGHSFLSDGQLLAVGGGGNYISNAINSGWRYKPGARLWEPTADPMHDARWYPTAVTFDPGKVFITSGYDIDTSEVYSEATDRFERITGGDRSFPETYPGLHLLPGGEIAFSRTGWHGPNDTGTKAAYFRFDGGTSGSWIDIDAADPMSHPDRTEGMSVLLLDHCGQATMMVVGGGLPNTGGRDNAESINMSTLHPTWGHPHHLPDERFHPNVVLLPTGDVFVSGGRPADNEASLMLPHGGHSWRTMAATHYRRQYHSTSLLLPSGKVMTTGGDTGNDFAKKTSIEIYSPPYLFRGSRPVITSADTTVANGGSLRLESPHASDIEKVVLVRPMAVTHQTDSEQRLLQLEFRRRGNTLIADAPGHRYPNHLAPRGYYMLFIVDGRGVPSKADFIRLT